MAKPNSLLPDGDTLTGIISIVAAITAGFGLEDVSNELVLLVSAFIVVGVIIAKALKINRLTKEEIRTVIAEYLALQEDGDEQ